MADTPVRIDIRQLRPGLYVSLGERWLDHMFLFNSFRLSTEAQIAKVREMGITHIDYWPGKSTTTPLPLDGPDGARSPAAANDGAPAAEAADPDAEADAAARDAEQAQVESDARRARRERVAERRAELARAARAYRRSIGAVKTVMTEVFVSPRDASDKADEVVGEILTDLLGNQHSVLQLMSDQLAEGGVRHHALNVMIVSLLLGRAAGLTDEQLQSIGLGALLHDLGKVQVPTSVLRVDPSARSRHEESAYRAHVDYGTAMLAELGIVDPIVVDIVRHHHERLDGSGFPDKLSAEAISIPVRVVAIANRYDGLCHPVDPGRALSPAEALATMYRQDAGGLDATLMQRLVKALGVWPPGTIVSLSNGAIGQVVGVDAADTLRPTVLLADLSVPRAEALIVDLREAPDVKVTRALRPSEVDPDLLEYLSPRKRPRTPAAA